MHSKKWLRNSEGIKPTNKMGVLILLYLVSACQTLIFKPKDPPFKVKIYALKPSESSQFSPQLFRYTHGSMSISAYVIFVSFYDECREMESVNSEVWGEKLQSDYSLKITEIFVKEIMTVVKQINVDLSLHL